MKNLSIKYPQALINTPTENEYNYKLLISFKTR